jgi:hypothetical protein
MQSRPRSLAIIGWTFIAVGALGILKDVWPLFTANAAQHLAGLLTNVWTDLAPALTSRLLAVIGGAFILSGANWARWLLVVWMVAHIVISALHSATQVLTHTVIFAAITYCLFRAPAALYFRARDVAR